MNSYIYIYIYIYMQAMYYEHMTHYNYPRSSNNNYIGELTTFEGTISLVIYAGTLFMRIMGVD